MIEILRNIEDVVKKELNVNSIILKKQKNNTFGDYSMVLFPIAKLLKKSPAELADIIIEKINEVSGVEKSEFVNGFVNIYIKKQFLFDKLVKNIFGNISGKKSDNHKKIVIDYSSPNIAKPFSIGHLRSTIIGNILANMYEGSGYEVERVNHLGDWGTQFGKVLVAIEKWGDWKEIEKDPVKGLLALYVKFHDMAEQDESLEDQAREAFALLERKNEKYYEIWKYIVKISIENIEKIYNRLSVHFDKYLGESFYEPMMDDVLKRLEEKNLVVESDGALVVDLDEFNMPPCLLKKKDGSSLYALRDITAALYRFEEMKADKIVYVVGNEQKLHFKQVFKVIELFKPEYKGKTIHVGFGLYKFKDMKMSTRKGNVIFMEDVLDEAREKASLIMKDRGFDNEHLQEISDIVGTGAVIFNDICADRNKDVDFDWDRILDFNGETAPYIQYTQVRIRSILEKAGADKEQVLKNQDIRYNQNYEEALKKLDDFNKTLELAVSKDQPYIMANFLIELCSLFNSFYNKEKVLSDDQEVRVSHITFISLILEHIIKGLILLGIKMPEKM